MFYSLSHHHILGTLSIPKMIMCQIQNELFCSAIRFCLWLSNRNLFEFLLNFIFYSILFTGDQLQNSHQNRHQAIIP